MSALFVIALAAVATADENVWVSHGPTGYGWVNDVVIADAIAYAATPNGVFRSDDGGVTWRQSGLPGAWIDQIVARSGASVVFARSRSALYLSRDGGQSWASAGVPSIFTVAIDPGNPSTAYAATDDFQIAKSIDAGATWQFPSSLSGAGYVRGFAFDSSAVYVLDDSLGIIKSLDGGASWLGVPQPQGAANTLIGITAGKSGVLYVASISSFCRSSDEAANWTCSPLPGFPYYDGSIVELPGDSPGAVPRILVTGGSAGLLSSRDGGATWVETAPGLGTHAVDPHGLASDDSGSVVLAGTDRRILRSSDRGDTWVISSAGLQSAWMQAIAVDPEDSSTVWAGVYGAGGLGPGLFHSSDAGLSWSPIDAGPTDVRALAIDPQHSSTIYTGGDGVSRTEDGGTTWALSRPSAGYVNSIVLDPNSPQDVWADAFKSDDGAQTWNPASISQSVFSLLFDRRNPDTMYAGALYTEGGTSDYGYGYDYPSGGSIFVSHDRGASFTQGTLNFGSAVYSIVADPFHDRVLYAGAISTGVFRSLDGGQTWWPASQGLPVGTPSGIRILKLVVDPVRPGVLYCATSQSVFRTLDGAQTWIQFSEGLPTTLSVSDLAVSPDGRTLHAASSGGGIFELALPAPAAVPCTASATRLCLVGNRYAVELLAALPGVSSGPGAARPLGDRAGYFGLPFESGDPDLPEVVVKMLADGAFGPAGAPIFYSSLTTLPFVFTVTDTVTGQIEFYDSNPGAPFCGATDLPFREAEVAMSPRVSPAAEGEAALQLLSGRFSVTLDARRPQSGQVVHGVTMSSGDRFGFFSLPDVTGDPQFPEVVVKMIDGRAITGKFWFFYTGLTSLDYTLTVTDSATGAVRTYESATPLCGVADTNAFADEPSAGQ